MSVISIKRTLSTTLLLLIIASTFLFYAYSEGITGKTKKNGLGCDCHGVSPSAGVTVTISGPDQLAVNETGNYTVTISGGPLTAGGTNIAASSGVLTPGAGLRKEGTELTHQLPRVSSGGSVTFDFTFTASEAGSVTLFANGNSVNFNGQESGDQWNFANNKSITVTNPTDILDKNLLNTFKLDQNFPNPFNPVTNINYSIPEAGNIKLVVYNLPGDEVATLVDGFKNAGNHTIQFRAENISSGIYFYKIISDKFTSTKKMLLTK